MEPIILFRVDHFCKEVGCARKQTDTKNCLAKIERKICTMYRVPLMQNTADKNLSNVYPFQLSVSEVVCFFFKMDMFIVASIQVFSHIRKTRLFKYIEILPPKN